MLCLIETTSGVSSATKMAYQTQVLPAHPGQIGRPVFANAKSSFLDRWTFELSDAEDAVNLRKAASCLRESETPVAFPTETVYGLGADATRRAAVCAIYAAKQRPADNPLIVHVSSISQLRKLLRHGTDMVDGDDAAHDPIPPVYRALIDRFWPGPLTILLPLPHPSPFAPQVTAGLPTFAVRMPSSLLALALIHLAGVPIAAPSANASTRPSPTSAAHVLNDLSGRIEIILDGGPCEVGVESTVVDGLSNPPVVLRPGGVSLEALRQCPGWEEVVVGYKDTPQEGAPRAPGMKYKHYSPTATVVLVERALDTQLVAKHWNPKLSLGLVATRTWGNLSIIGARPFAGHNDRTESILLGSKANFRSDCSTNTVPRGQLLSSAATNLSQISIITTYQDEPVSAWVANLGGDTVHIARGLFSALRGLDEKGVDVIFVEGISDKEANAAAAIMNRLRKAADQIEC